MFKCHNLLCRDNVVPDIKTLQLALFEGICKHFNIVHNDSIVGDVKISEGVVLAADDLTKFCGCEA